MPKINVYLPDDLAQEVRARGIAVSRIAQQALREEVERMRTIEQNIPESKELLADIRRALAFGLENQARWRERIADEYPEDKRNARSADALQELAEELRINDTYDHTPALRKLLGLVTEYNLDLDHILPSDPSTGFDASRFRFQDAAESDDSFLERLADALEDEVKEMYDTER